MAKTTPKGQGGPSKAKRGRSPKALQPSEVAEILFFGESHSLKETVEQFGISERTVKRYRAAHKAGKSPDVSRLVTEERQAVLTRNRDLICETVDKGLKELQARFPKMSDKLLIDAIDKIGGLRVTREALSGNAEPSEPTGQGPGAEAHADPDAGGAGRAPPRGAVPGFSRGDAQTH